MRATALLLAIAMPAMGQDAMAQERVTAREVAPVDLTGYWTAVVTEDWRWRMVTPPRGDYASLPLNDEGRRVADGWDPAEGDTCKVYGAAGVMRMPLRVHITWEDGNTLRIDTDHGTQTRLLHFGPGAMTPAEHTLQGYSTAHWGREDIGFDRENWREADIGTTLKVTTTHMSPGYLRRNGVPYGSETVMTEYYDRHAAYGEEWFTVTSIVSDPQHLTQEFITSSSFKRLPDGSAWNPVPCGSG